jgi:hypothetical protein
VEVDHATLNRWVLKYVPLLEQEFRARKQPVGLSWRMDETDVRVKGTWKYLYRAVDKAGLTSSSQCERVAAYPGAVSGYGVPGRPWVSLKRHTRAIIRGRSSIDPIETGAKYDSTHAWTASRP